MPPGLPFTGRPAPLNHISYHMPLRMFSHRTLEFLCTLDALCIAGTALPSLNTEIVAPHKIYNHVAPLSPVACSLHTTQSVAQQDAQVPHRITQAYAHDTNIQQRSRMITSVGCCLAILYNNCPLTHTLPSSRSALCDPCANRCVLLHCFRTTQVLQAPAPAPPLLHL